MSTHVISAARRRIGCAALFAIVLALGAATMAAVWLYGWNEARSDPVVRRVRITLDGADPQSAPLRIALVSDIHVGNLAMPVSRLNRIVDQINAQHPDVVLIAGDLVNGDAPNSKDFHPREFIVPLARLHAPRGVIAVLGNHDDETSPTQVVAALHQAGIMVLRDRAIRMGPIALMGIGMSSLYPYKIAPVLASAHRIGGVPVILTHAPPFKGQVPPGIPLVLAGHTHCGQVVFPGWDDAFDPFHWHYRFDPRVRCGVANIWNQVIVVGGGVGAATILPIRINAPPDFWMVTLVPRRSTGAISAPTDRQNRRESMH